MWNGKKSNPYNTQVELKFLLNTTNSCGFINYQNTMYNFKLNTDLTQNLTKQHMYTNVQKL